MNQVLSKLLSVRVAGFSVTITERASVLTFKLEEPIPSVTCNVKGDIRIMNDIKECHVLMDHIEVCDLQDHVLTFNVNSMYVSKAVENRPMRLFLIPNQ